MYFSNFIGAAFCYEQIDVSNVKDHEIKLKRTECTLVLVFGAAFCYEQIDGAGLCLWAKDKAIITSLFMRFDR